MKEFLINEKEAKATWIYEYNMWKNLTIFLTIWKIFVLCALAPAFVVFITMVGNDFTEASLNFVKIFGMIVGIISILLFISYIMVCFINGGKYIVVFELDDLGIKHIQMDRQFTKAQGIAYIGAIIGAFKKDLITIGSNLLASSKNSIYSEFKKVRKVESIERRNTIKIKTSDGFNNQIYVDNEHYKTILKMIIDKCPENTMIKMNEVNINEKNNI